MKLQNDQKSEKTVNSAQTESAITSVNLSVAPVEDMELNEEQLDIISGGGDGSVLIVR